MEPEPERGSAASAEDEAEIRATIPLQARSDLEPSLPVPDDARKTTDATAVGMPTEAAFQMHSLDAADPALVKVSISPLGDPMQESPWA